MTKLYSIPSLETLTQLVKDVPNHMHPSIVPWMVICEGALNDKVCDSIIEATIVEEPYTFQGCSATTRECSRPLNIVLDPIIQFTLEMNNNWWQFDLDNNPGAWLQTYSAGGSYQLHADGHIGQTRKLSTIALLSDPSTYEGGVLRIIPYPEEFDIPKTRGTLCIFPSWILHKVYKVESGLRQTINMGFWGPPFK